MEKIFADNSALKEYFVLGLICIGAFCLYVFNNNFPIFFHSDEPKKLSYVLLGTQDFKHPILLLQLGRIANLFFRETDQQTLITICRTISALAGIAMVVASYFFARILLDNKYRWYVALLIAVSPILVVHAHYYKEDMVFTAATLFSLFFYLQYIQSRSRMHFIGLCVATAFALSTQYKGVLLIPLYLLFPLLDSRFEKHQLYKGLFGMLGIAMAISLVINYPAIIDPEQFIWGITKETEHISYGHTLRIYPLAHYFSFHLVNSLYPGLTLPILVLGLSGLVLSMFRWRAISTGLRLLIVYVLFFYFVHEATPMKPAPGFMRYMIPITPVLILYSVYAFIEIKKLIYGNLSLKASGLVTIILLAALIVTPLYKSIMLVQNFNYQDTRSQAMRWLAEKEEKVYYGKHTMLPSKKSGRIYKIDDKKLHDMRSGGYRYAVASSFGYDIYYQGAEMDGQIKRIKKYKNIFDGIFETYPYVEFRPNYQSFAFSNPVIRILDLAENPHDL